MSILKKLAQRAALAVGVAATAITVAVKYGAVAAAAVGVTSTIGVIAVKAAVCIATARVASMVAQGIIRYTGFGNVGAELEKISPSKTIDSVSKAFDVAESFMNGVADGYNNAADNGAAAHQAMYHSGI